MKKLLLISFALLICSEAFAQEALSIRGKKVSNGALFLSLSTDKKQVRYLTNLKNDSGDKEVKEGMVFSLKENSSNVYFRWLNPLKYRIVWKDSLFNDEQDKKVKDFVSLLIAQFGNPVSSLNKSSNLKVGDFTKNAKPEPLSDPTKMTAIKIHLFDNANLLEVFIRLSENQNKLTEGERVYINSLGEKLKALEDESSKNISEMVDVIFIDLYKIEHPDIVEETVKQKKDDRDDKINKIIQDVSKNQSAINSVLKDFTVSSYPALGLYAKKVISEYFESTVSKLKSEKILVEKLENIFEVMNKSISNKKSNAGEKEYFILRDLNFDEGKVLKTTLTLSEFEYKKEAKEYVKKSDVITKTMKFRGYDLFAFSVSAGIFHSTTTLAGFGVSTKDNLLVVKKDNIEKNEPVTATFLNANISINSRYFSPLLQIGIDPTKKRPFLLGGGGFSIPVAKIAISGGWIFTWSQSLDKLSEGQTITSTTDLEKDIKYKFNGLGNRGYYIGIQYNF